MHQLTGKLWFKLRVMLPHLRFQVGNPVVYDCDVFRYLQTAESQAQQLHYFSVFGGFHLLRENLQILTELIQSELLLSLR